MTAAVVPLVVFVVVQSFAPPTPAPGSYETGRSAFARGEYARAIAILRPLLYPEMRLQSEAEVAITHRMLGVAHLFEGQNEPAGEEFRKLLQLRPDYRMDPLLDPPRVVDFFNGIVREQEATLADLDVERHAAEVEDRRRQQLERPRAAIDRKFIRNSFAVNFIPFGAGQFQNGQPRKGWTFFAVEGLLASASLGTFAANFAIYGFRPRYACRVSDTTTTVASGPCPSGQALDTSPQDTSRALSQAAQMTGWLFLGVTSLGILDAILHFRPEDPLSSEGPSLRFAPLVLGGGPGAGLHFRF